MKAFVTGHNGFVGKNLVKGLEAEGVEIEKMITRYLTIRDADKIKNCDYVFNCAAELYDESGMIDSNVKLTKNLCIASKEANLKAFIHIGSSSEFGKVDHYIHEDMPLRPTNLYEVTKAASSQLCRIYAKKYNKPIVVVRPFSLYGPHERERRLVPTIYNKIKANEPAEIYDGFHDWVYIDDFIDALMIIAKSGPEKITGDAVNIGTGIQSTNEDVFNAFKSLEGFENANMIKKRGFSSQYDHTTWVCNTQYARNKYGIQCNTHLNDGIRKYVEWRQSIN